MEYWRQWNVSYIIPKTNSGYEKLEKCVANTGAETLAQYSSSVIDPVLNGFVNEKSFTAIVAAEIWHHRTCMRDLYTKTSKETDGFLKKEMRFSNVNVINNGQLYY